MSYLSILIAMLALLPGQVQEEDLRSLSGMSDPDIAAVEDNQTLDPGNAQFRKILYRTGTVDPVVMRQWASRSDGTSVDQIAAHPSEFRFHPFSMDANVQSISRYDYSAENAKNFFEGFYIAKCETTEGQPFVLVSRSSVSSWPLGKELPAAQLIQFSGFFLGNLAMESGSEPLPVFVARRFAWYPTTENESLQIDAGKIALAKAGVDISLLDIVKAQKGKPIANRESICFWQMLAACSKPTGPSVSNPIGFASMLRDPIDSVGKAASIQGRIRQCVPVKITEAEPIELLGTDTWYQLTIFPDLDGRPIKVATRDGEPEVYKNAFPVTVCVTKLPAEFNSESIVGSTFVFDGFFYRIWSYPSERTEKSSLDGQPSPLMMASTMRMVKSTSGQLQTFLMAIILAMVIAVAVVGWYVFKSKKIAPRKELPETIDAW